MYRFRWWIFTVIFALWISLLAWSFLVIRPPGSEVLRVACSSIDDLCEEWSRMFTSQSGIDTRMVRLPSGQALARLANEREVPEFDVWHGGTSDTYSQAARASLLAPYVSPLAVDIPAKYRDPNGYWTGTYVGLLGFCSNRELLREIGTSIPTHWDDLLDPRLVRRVSMSNPASSGTAYTALWTQVQLLGGEPAAINWFAKLDQNVLQYTASGLAPAGVVARGEAAVALVFSQHCIKARIESGADLVVSYPVEGTGYEVGGVAIVAGTPRQAAAQAYVDFALSISAQEATAGGSSQQLPTNPRARIGSEVASSASTPLIRYDVSAAALARSRLLAEFEQVRRG